MYNNYDDIFDFDNELTAAAKKAEKEVKPLFDEIQQVAEYNQCKVLKAFHQHHLSDFHFYGSTGYGYDDLGRETLEKVFATLFGAEAALVRPNIVSGTHAIAIAYFGNLRPGDELLAVGQPYETLTMVIETAPGSLAEWGVSYREIAWNMLQNSSDIKNFIAPNTRMISIQRSRGYSWNAPRSIEQIEKIIAEVKSINDDIICFVDNCYGEFVEEKEPVEIGADLIAGSLIKNPGGGFANNGGYLVGKMEFVEQAANRLTAPGLGSEIGAIPEGHRLEFQGLFMAPHIVGEALKGAIFAAKLLEDLGFEVSPSYREKRTDIVQAVRLPTKKALIAFCQGVQKVCAVNAHHLPEPSKLPGYQEKVIMAAGGFVQGASLELSSDAPLRPPYTAYFQGGLSYLHAKLGLLSGLNEMLYG